MTFYCKVCYVHVFLLTSLSNCDFINMFKDIDSNLAQLIDNVRLANLEVSPDIYSTTRNIYKPLQLYKLTFI